METKEKQIVAELVNLGFPLNDAMNTAEEILKDDFSNEASLRFDGEVEQVPKAQEIVFRSMSSLQGYLRSLGPRAQVVIEDKSEVVILPTVFEDLEISSKQPKFVLTIFS